MSIKIILANNFQKKKYFFLSIVWGILILLGCLLPGSSLPSGFRIPHFDKIIHAYLYGQWFWFIFKSISIPNKAINYPKVLFFGGLCLLYGFIIELIQHNFVSNRSFEFGDLVANFLGLFITFCIVAIWPKKSI